VDPRAGRVGDRRSEQFFAECREQLIGFAAYQKWLGELVDNGIGGKCTRRDKYQSLAEKQNREALEILEGGPEFPAAFLDFWELWGDLARGRDLSVDGQQLTWTGLRNWAELRGYSLSQYQMTLMFDLDQVRPAKEQDLE
jgi:hypothetical protein